MEAKEKNITECSTCGKEEGTNKRCARCFDIRNNVHYKKSISSEKTEDKNIFNINTALELDSISQIFLYTAIPITGIISIIIIYIGLGQVINGLDKADNFLGVERTYIGLIITIFGLLILGMVIIQITLLNQLSALRKIIKILLKIDKKNN